MFLPLLRTRLTPLTTATRSALLSCGPCRSHCRIAGRGHFAAMAQVTDRNRRRWDTPKMLTVPRAAMSTKPTLPKLEPEESAKARIRKRVFFRFLDYLAGYGKNVLDKIIPEKAKEFYRLFKDGSMLLLKDMKEFWWMYSVLSGTSDWNKACTTLSRRQLELYMTLPTDLKRVAPVLIVSALPMAQNVVFPLALMYPKQLLSSHFWTPEVKKQIVSEQQLARHLFYRKLLRDLTRTIKHQDSPKVKRLLKILTVEGAHPSPEQILQVRAAFSEGEKGFLRLSALNSLHVRHLMGAHGLTDWFWWRYKLIQYANLLHHIDLAILREGGVGYMGDADLRYVCLWRGLNATEDVSRDDMLDYLGRWMAVSEKLGTDCPSLLLHLPLLIGYNHQSRHWDDQTVI